MKRPAVFFDRDNTLIVSDGYLGDPAQVILVDGAADAVAKARQYGFKVFTFSNQSGVARGLFTEDAVRAVNGRMDEMLQKANPAAAIQNHAFCPHHPEAKVQQYRKACDERKPAPGMLLKLAQQFNLDLARSWVVGDTPRDIEAGKAAGCRTILFTAPNLPKSPAASEESSATADFKVSTLKEAANVIGREAFKPSSAAPNRTGNTSPSATAAATAEGASATGDSAAMSTSTVAVDDADIAEEMPERLVATDDETGSGAMASSVDDTASAGSLDDAPADEPAVDEASPSRRSRPILRELEPPVEVHDEGVERASAPVVAAEASAAASAPAMPAAREAAVTEATAAAPVVPTARLEALAEQILQELRSRRQDTQPDFSVSKLFAGVVQVIAIATLFFAYFYRDTPSTLQSLLLVSIAFQTLTTSLLIMGGQR